MITKLQQSNLALANQLTKKISKLSHIKAVLLYGSVGKGYSDAYSDIDLVIVCDIPHAKVFSKTNDVATLFPEYVLDFKEQELDVLHFDQYPSKNSYLSNHLSFRAACSIVHDGRTIDTTIRLISASVVKTMSKESVHDIYKYQTLMQYIVDTKTLFAKDKEFVAWKKKAVSFKTFAPVLQKIFIKHCIEKIDYYLKGEIPDSIIRNDIVLTHYELSKCIVLFLNVLYAVNDRCLSYPKWEHEDIKTLPIKPPRVQKILEHVIKTQNPAPIGKLLDLLMTISKISV